MKKTAPWRYCLPLILLSSLLLLSSSAWAHRVTIFAWVDGETIHTESKFGGGQKVRGGKVLVLDTEGNRLLEGVTDQDGKFSFPVPQKTALNIVLDATMGHRAEWHIPLDEISGIQKIEAAVSPGNDKSAPPQTPPRTAVSVAEIEELMERLLERKLTPINHMLAQIQQPGPSFRDIFSGIGYILGLMGVAAWVRYHRQR